MELLQGCQNETEQFRVEQFCQGITLYWPTAQDCENSLHDYSLFHLSNNLGILDALIAHTAVGLNATLVTFNPKHYGVVAGLKTSQPY